MHLLTRIVYRSSLGDFLVLCACREKIHAAAPDHAAGAQVHGLSAVQHARYRQAALVLLAFVAARLRNDWKRETEIEG